jgi:hypothetical protein
MSSPMRDTGVAMADPNTLEAKWDGVDRATEKPYPTGWSIWIASSTWTPDGTVVARITHGERMRCGASENRRARKAPLTGYKILNKLRTGPSDAHPMLLAGTK